MSALIMRAAPHGVNAWAVVILFMNAATVMVG
jgi:hypothetical protein